jgi:hypothetical protein
LSKFLIPSFAGFLFVLLHVSDSAAKEESIDHFVGRWVGTGVTENKGSTSETETADRHIQFQLRKTTRGFTIIWSTIKRSVKKKARKKKQSTTSENFSRTTLPGLFKLVSRANPMCGGRFRWASINGKTLVVHSIAVSSDGVLEHLIYARTLVSRDEISLKFSRALDDQVVRRVTGTIRRKF